MKFAATLKKTLIVILIILLFAAVALNVYVMVCASKGKAAVVGGSCIVQVSTGSMQPSISVGDYILVKEVPIEELAVGDIISFYSEDSEIYGKINTHRIVERVDGGFVTKGDANPIEDKVIAHDDHIIGKYNGKIRYFRWLGSFKSARKLMLLSAILITLGISIYEVITISKLKAEIVAENDKVDTEEHEEMLRKAIEEEKERLRRENFQPDKFISSEDKSSTSTGDDEA